ncbi:MAG: NusG domain II-containing protein [Oscillospiraceae bacterium]
MVKTRTWIIIIAAFLLICAALTLWLGSRTAPGVIANIYQDGVCIRSIDLSLVTEAYSFTIESERGSNTVLVEPGRICISEADCPDLICVEDGWLEDSAAPIVCLPHRLVIKLEETAKASDGIDSVSK